MANPGYVRSTDGNNSDNGSTWALANADLATAMADHSAGDTIYVSDNHAETVGGTITSPGTLASPCKIICADDAAEPPTAVAATATITTATTTAITINGCHYVYGLTLNCGSGFNNTALTLNGTDGNESQVYEECVFNIVASGVGAVIYLGAAANVVFGRVDWINCDCSFAATGQSIITRGLSFTWRGGALNAGSALPTSLMSPSATQRPIDIVVDGVDLSQLGSGKSLVNVANMTAGEILFRNCKLGSSVSLVTGTWAVPGPRVRAENCDDGGTDPSSIPLRLSWASYEGTVVTDSGVYRDSGAAQPNSERWSYKMVSSANTEYPTIVLRSPEIFAWNATVGSSQTATIEIVNSGSSVTLNNDEVWLELHYLGTSGQTLATVATDCKASFLASAGSQDSSSEAWTGDSAGWTTQKLVVTFTAQEPGPVIATVCLAKASTTVYIDPLLTIA